MHCCTEKESENLGVFFLELFTALNSWSKPDVWEKECEGNSAFAKIIGSSTSIQFSEYSGPNGINE